MTTDDIILQIICLVENGLLGIPKHLQAKVYASTLVTIDILFLLKGGHN